MPHQATLALSLFPQEQHVMLRQKANAHFRNHRVLKADDAGE